MSILAVASEDGDVFGGSGSFFQITASTYRSNYVRGALRISDPNMQAAVNFSATQEIWISARWMVNNGGWPYSNVTTKLLSLYKAGIKRLELGSNGGLPGVVLPRLYSWTTAGASTTLLTGPTYYPENSLVKLDFHIKYAVAGWFRMYVGGALIFEYVGDVTKDGITSLDSVRLGALWNQAGHYNYWSEVIVADEDTRGMSLARLTPLAAGNTQDWSGSVSDINESTLDDATLISSASANQVAQFTVTPASIIAGTIGIRGVAVNARAMRGSSGPQNAQMSVRTGGADYFSATKSLEALGVVSNVWNTNPGGGSWTAAQLTAAGFNVGIKSVA